MLVACALAVAPAACGGPATNRPTVDPDDAVVTFDHVAGAADATLWINGHYVGELGALAKGVALSPGEHRLEIRHDEFFTQYVELILGKRDRRTVTVELAEILP